MPSQNYLKSSLLGTALVLGILGILYLIPEFDIGTFHFKRINMLADVIDKKADKKTTVTDSVPILAKVIKPVYLDTCKTGVTCIEDYSPDTTGLQIFFSALDSSKSHVVRIAYFADSYVEGDIMLDPLRDSLQALFGGSGVGFVPITSEVATFRQTVIHSFANWKTYSMVGEQSTEHPLGPAGVTASALEEGSTVSYRGANRNRLKTLPTSKIWYGNADSAALLIGADTVPVPLRQSRRLQAMSFKRPMQGFKFGVAYQKTLDLYGVSFEDTVGVCVDNFSVRGNSGTGLSYVKEQMYRDFDSLHHYDLVVIAYGLNVANDKAKDYNWYIRTMDPTVKMIKRAFPNSSILMVGCSDRATKVDGEMVTMPMLKELIAVQRQMAADNGVCFWNLFDATGGDSTMIHWANTTPPMANKDYTHVTGAGGRKIAGLMMGTLLYEREKFERRKKLKITNPNKEKAL